MNSVSVLADDDTYWELLMQRQLLSTGSGEPLGFNRGVTEQERIVLRRRALLAWEEARVLAPRTADRAIAAQRVRATDDLLAEDAVTTPSDVADAIDAVLARHLVDLDAAVLDGRPAAVVALRDPAMAVAIADEVRLRRWRVREALGAGSAIGLCMVAQPDIAVIGPGFRSVSSRAIADHLRLYAPRTTALLITADPDAELDARRRGYSTVSAAASPIDVASKLDALVA